MRVLPFVSRPPIAISISSENTSITLFCPVYSLHFARASGPIRWFLIATAWDAHCFVAATSYSQVLKSTSTTHHLCGLAVVEISDKLIISMTNDLPPADVSDTVAGFSIEVKDTLMLNLSKSLHSALSIYEQTLKLDYIAAAAKIYDIV
jgi:hypothetical protein